VLEEFHAIQSADVVLPITDDCELRLRLHTKLEAAVEKMQYQSLDLFHA